MNGWTYEGLATEFDGVTLLDYVEADGGEDSLGLQDDRLENLRHIILNWSVMVDVDGGGSNDQRMEFFFNTEDTGNRYAYSNRLYIDKSATPPAQEAPYTDQRKDNTLRFLPNNSSFFLATNKTVFRGQLRLHKHRQQEVMNYSGFADWAIEVIDGSNISIPRWGHSAFMYASAGVVPIGHIMGRLHGTGGNKFLLEGSYMEVFGIESGVLGAGYLYKDADLPSGKVWTPTGDSVNRKMVNVTDWPSAGQTKTVAHGVSNVVAGSCHMVEGWMTNGTSTITLPDPYIRVTCNATNILIKSMSGPPDGDFSSYNDGYIVIEYRKSA